MGTSCISSALLQLLLLLKLLLLSAIASIAVSYLLDCSWTATVATLWHQGGCDPWTGAWEPRTNGHVVHSDKHSGAWEPFTNGRVVAFSGRRGVRSMWGRVTIYQTRPHFGMQVGESGCSRMRVIEKRSKLHLSFLRKNISQTLYIFDWWTLWYDHLMIEKACDGWCDDYRNQGFIFS